MPEVRWSTFLSAEDSAPKPHSGTWQELAKLLTTIHQPPTSGRLAGEKKGMPAFSGTIFRENARRGVESVETIHLLVFDFDNATEEPTGEFYDAGKTRPKMRKVPSAVVAQPQDVCAHLEAQNITFRAYTTWSSKPDWVRFRLVVPLKVPVTPDVWDAATEYGISALGLTPWRAGIDVPVLRDTARLQFLPGAPNGEPVRFWGHDGEMFFLETDGLERIDVPAIAKNNYARPKKQDEIDWSRYGIEISSLQLSELLEKLGCVLGRPRTLSDGGRKFRCTCPWGMEHSHGPDGDDAVIMETPGKWPAFSCAHSVHSHMGLSEVLDLALEQKIDLFDYAEKVEAGVMGQIEQLSDTSPMTTIVRVLEGVQRLPNLQAEVALKRVKQKTGLSMAALRFELRGLARTKQAVAGETEDLGRRMAETMLERYFAGGAHLVQALDKSWWCYTGTHWRRMANENSLRHYLLDIIKDQGPGDERESALIDNAFKILSAMQAKDQDVLRLSSEQPRVVNCRNGELWIAPNGSVTLKPHRAESYLTYVLNVDYDPAAVAPIFEAAVLDTFSRAENPEDMARHFYEFMGYAIQPRREYKTWWLFQGSGNNGKTKLIQTLQRLMNSSCIYPTRMKDADKNEHSRAALAGKLLLLDDDVDTGTVLPDGFLKQVSEDKLLSGRNLYASTFEFISTVVPVMLCNNFPLARDLSQATQKRAMIVPFGKVFDPRAGNPFPKVWEKEMAGVLNLALAGYKRLQERGGFSDPVDCAVAKKRFLAAANPLVDFIENGCEKAPNYGLPSTEFYGAYRGWASMEGHTYIAKKSDVERDLISLGFDVSHDTHVRQKLVRGLRPWDPKDF